MTSPPQPLGQVTPSEGATLPSQAGNTGVSEGVLSFRDAAKHADALAVAPYMPYSIGRGKSADPGEQKNLALTTPLGSFREALARAHGMQVGRGWRVRVKLQPAIDVKEIRLPAPVRPGGS